MIWISIKFLHLHIRANSFTKQYENSCIMFSFSILSFKKHVLKERTLPIRTKQVKTLVINISKQIWSLRSRIHWMNFKHYLLPGSVISTSSTSKGQSNSGSSKSSGKDLLELLENEICGESLDDIFVPKCFLLSSFPRENNYSR